MARSAPALHNHHNLPTHATVLVGRDREVADLRRLLLSDDGRLVTLTGVGGCGKTRLALGVASSVIGSFKDGVWLVELAALADPQLVPQATASVLGVRERSDRSLLDALVALASALLLASLLTAGVTNGTGGVCRPHRLAVSRPRRQGRWSTTMHAHVSSQAWRVIPSLRVCSEW